MALITSAVSELRSILTGGSSMATPSRRLPLHGGPTPARFTASPVGHTPGTADAIVGINDDAAERRKRRLETHMRTAMSPGCHTPRNVTTGTDPKRVHADSGTSSLSNAQIADHYANCIKLSSENKINAKNAFGLHLIDYMMEMLRKMGEMTNFQVAGCTLDASAKIYAGRVDSIYNDAFKMLGGLGRGETQQGQEGDEGGEGGEKEGTQNKRRRKKSNLPSSHTIEKNPQSLDVNTFDLEFEVDPLFKKTSAAFDEGGVEGLLMNQLCVRDDSCALMLDAKQIPPSRDTPLQTSSDISIRELAELVDLHRLQQAQICPTFSTFKFNGYDKEDPWNIEHLLTGRSTQESPSANQYRPEPDTSCSMLQQPQSVSGDEDGDGDYGGGEEGWPEGDDYIAGNEEVRDNFTVAGETTVLGVCGDTGVAKPIPPDRVNAGGGVPMMGGVGELCLSEALQLSEYSYFDPVVMSTWAGPQHWKLRPRNTKKDDTENPLPGEGKKRKRQQKKQFKIDFTQVPNDAPLTKSRAATTLAKTTLNRQRASQTTLPRDTHIELDVLFKLFSRPKWKITRQKRVIGPVDENMDGVWYDYGNTNDNANYCPMAEQGWRGDESDGDDVDGAVDFSQPFNDTAPDFYNQSRGLPFNATQLPDSLDQLQPLLLAGDNLVAQPKKVQQIQIDYARAAKKVDVKKLKAKMWEIIDRDGAEDKENLSENEVQLSPDTNGKQGTRFSELYSELPSRLSTTMARNVSIPICYVCLLHLANEKSLRISGLEDMSDLKIETNTI